MTDFYLHLTHLGYSTSMRRQIRSAVSEYQSRYPHYLLATPQELETHYHYLSERPNQRRSGGLSSITIGHHLYSLRLLYSYLVEEGYREDHPMSGLHFPKEHPAQRQVLSRVQIGQLYAASETPTERAILTVCYGCGLRRSEAAQLQLRDVALREDLLYVRKGKGGRSRIIPLTKSLRTDLRIYLHTDRRDRLEKCQNPDPSAFFLGYYGNRMQGATLYKRFKALLARTDLPQEISLHHLRHSIATHLLHQGMAIEEVRDFLGHKQLESTQVYTRMEL